MKTFYLDFIVVAAVGLFSSCVSSQQSEDEQLQRHRQRVSQLPLRSESYGILDREDEVYPWLGPKYDKGIYSSSAPTAPFRENSLTTENLRKRIQKTSKKAR